MLSRRVISTSWLFVGVIILVLLLAVPSNLNNAGYRNLGMIKLASSEVVSPDDDLARPVGDSDNWFEQGLKKFPEDTRMLYALALSYWLQGDVTNARSTMESYAKAVPGDGTARFVLGDIAYNSGDITTALQIWSVDSNGMVLIEQARKALELGNLYEAQQLLDVALTTDVTSYSIAYRLAEQYTILVGMLQDSGDVKRIASACDYGSIAYESAIRAEPTLGFVKIIYGGLLRRCNRYEDAIGQYQSIDDSSTLTTRAWANHEIALTYRILNERDRALDYFERAVDLDPQNGLYRLSLGKVYAELDRYEDARKEFQDVISAGDFNWHSAASEALSKLDNANKK